MGEYSVTSATRQRLTVAGPTQGARVRTFCTFRAGNGLYGIDVMSLREVSRDNQITPMPQSPPAVRGLTNLRSSILLVLDLRSLLGLPPIELTSESRLIILKPEIGESLGILVDGGGDIRLIPEDRIEDRLAAAGRLPAAVNAPPVKGSTTKISTGETANARPESLLVVGAAKLESDLMLIIDATRFAGIMEHLVGSQLSSGI